MFIYLILKNVRCQPRRSRATWSTAPADVTWSTISTARAT